MSKELIQELLEALEEVVSAADNPDFSWGSPGQLHPLLEKQRAAIAKAKAMPAPVVAVPDGYRLIKWPPTPEMIEAFTGQSGPAVPAFFDMLWQPQNRSDRDKVEAMLNASPPAPVQEPERVYAYRRKGMDYFCTCDEPRYVELSGKPDHFETAIFYTEPAPVQENGWMPIETAPDDKVIDVWVKSKNNPDFGRRACDVTIVDAKVTGSYAPNEYYGEYASHWMPLPPAPAGKEGV